MVSVAGPRRLTVAPKRLGPDTSLSQNATVVPGCDPSDTGKVQTTGPRPLRLIHEIERLELARVRRVHPTYGGRRSGAYPGRWPRPEPTRGMRLMNQLNDVYTGTGSGPY